MSLNIIPDNVLVSAKYFEYVCSTNTKYTFEDVEWMTQKFMERFDALISNVYNFYLTLTLLNQNTFCGYFTDKLNKSIYNAVQERDGKSFSNLIENPSFEEISANPNIDEEDRSDLSRLMCLELLTTNLTVLKIYVSDINCSIEKKYEDSFYELYYKMYRDVVKSYFVNYQKFVVISETINNIPYILTYDLKELLIQIIEKNSSLNLTRETISLLKERYDLEIKLLK